jgi:hypothetical protein
MKSRIEIIVRVFLRKLVVKVEIGTFWVATLTPIVGDALNLRTHKGTQTKAQVKKTKGLQNNPQNPPRLTILQHVSGSF